MPRTVIVVVGPGAGATPDDIESAFQLGRLIAQQGWVLVTGGRAAGVMDAVNRGAISAREAGEGNAADCITVGILPGDDASGVSTSVDVPIVTGLGDARNAINALTGDAMIACGIGPGTASEIALALKRGKKVIMLRGTTESRAFFAQMGAQAVTSIVQAIEAVKRHLTKSEVKGQR